jgi:hypothetical protein
MLPVDDSAVNAVGGRPRQAFRAERFELGNRRGPSTSALEHPAAAVRTQRSVA